MGPYIISNRKLLTYQVSNDRPGVSPDKIVVKVEVRSYNFHIKLCKSAKLPGRMVMVMYHVKKNHSFSESATAGIELPKLKTRHPKKFRRYTGNFRR